MFPSTPRNTLAAVALLATTAGAAQAATLLVTVKNDSYDGVCNLHCSLRDAVAVANLSGEANTILLPSGEYVLSSLDSLGDDDLPIDEDDNLTGDLDITGDLRIKGAGTANSIIKGPSDHYRAVTHRLMEVRPGARLIVERLALEDGHSPYNGGAVENHGRLLVREVRAENNRARIHFDFTNPGDTPSGKDADGGGAVANYGELVVLAAQFINNGAVSAHDKSSGGGAIYNRGNLQLRDSHFLANWVTAPYATAAFYDGGSALYNRGQAVVERNSFEFNGDYGNEGAIANEGGTLTLTNSTLSGNWNDGLTNGLHDRLPRRRSKATLTHVTITGNGLFGSEYGVLNRGELVIRNSVIAGNQDLAAGRVTNCRNVGHHFSYQAVGLLMNGEKSNCTADFFVPFEQTFTTVLSRSATELGNGTQAHTLLPGSPAIDAGIGDCIGHDQGGTSRPQDGNGDGVAVCDLGALELMP